MAGKDNGKSWIRMGTLVKRYREEQRVTQRELAAAAGMSLGPLAAWRDGAPLPLGSARQRAVLGVLALHAGTDVHRDVLIDLLWDERPPPTAVSKVQSYISWLRNVLGARPARDPGPELITT